MVRTTLIGCLALCMVLAVVGAAAAECNATLFSFNGGADQVDVTDIGPSGSPATIVFFVLVSNAGARMNSAQVGLDPHQRVTMTARELYGFLASTVSAIANTYVWAITSSPTDRLFALTVTRGGHEFAPPCATRSLIPGGTFPFP